MQRQMTLGLAALVLFTVVLGQPKAVAGSINLVQNASFQTGDLTSWTASGEVVAGGNSSVDSDGYDAVFQNSGSTLSQTLSTGPGTYNVQFYLLNGETYYNIGVANFNHDEFKVSLGGTTVVDVTSWVDGYPHYSATVTVTSANPVLQFEDVKSSGYLRLDDVSVTSAASTATTPEPASLTLLALGACGLAGYGWRKRRETCVVR